MSDHISICVSERLRTLHSKVIFNRAREFQNTKDELLDDSHDDGGATMTL